MFVFVRVIVIVRVRVRLRDSSSTSAHAQAHDHDHYHDHEDAYDSTPSDTRCASVRPMPIPVTLDAGVALLRLELGRGNAIDPAFVPALHSALDEASAAGARAVVLTGKGRVFCGGLDLVALHALDRPAMDRFITDFDGVFRRLFAFERPTVAAVNGHALAGGCILAMACDRRVMAAGPFQIGVNEVQIGLPFPAAAHEIVRRATPPEARSLVMLQGARLSPEQAHAMGIRAPARG